MIDTAIVLAGGLGSRLRPYTYVVPKPLIPVGKQPIVALLLEHLASEGFRRAVLAVGYHAELIQAVLGSRVGIGIALSYAKETSPLGTAGPIRLARDAGDIRETVAVMNGDLITKVDFRRMLETHRKLGAVLTVGTRMFRHSVPFGRVATSDDLITAIEEKPTISFPVSAGVYLLEPEAVDVIPPDAAFDMPDLINALIQKNKRVAAHEIREEWLAIENADDWRRFIDGGGHG